MKMIFGIVVGVLICGAVLAFGPKGTEATMRAAGEVASEKVEEVQADLCKKTFLEETRCFQNPNKTAEQCDAEVKAKCNPSKKKGRINDQR